jgi:hypothetical protein
MMGVQVLRKLKLLLINLLVVGVVEVVVVILVVVHRVVGVGVGDSYCSGG